MTGISGARADYESRAMQFNDAVYRLKQECELLLTAVYQDKIELPEITRDEVLRVDSTVEMIRQIQKEMEGLAR